MKAWALGQHVDKEVIAKILAWTTVPALNLKFRSREGLINIAILEGKPIMADKATQDKSKINFARVLTEMDVNLDFPSCITFMDDLGVLIIQEVDY